MFRITSLFVLGTLFLSVEARAGNIIINNDEWTLSDTGFTAEGAANGTTFAQNAASFLTGGPNGGATKIWIDSGNFGLAGADLKAALGAYNLTDTGAFSAFTLATLQGYQAVFLGGDNLTAAEEAALVSYVAAGGSVYVAAGTGSISGGAAGEAAQWNAFLNSYSLSLGTSYNGVNGTLPTSSTSPILNGVTQLFYNNGNTVSVTGANASIITATASGIGLIGEYSAATTSVPEPSTISFFGLAMVAAGMWRTKRR